MAVTLNSNIASMRTVRALGDATSQLSRTFERLSSGLRIVRPSDDAAGLAISTSLGVDTRVFNRARLNINDAQSTLQIADGATGEISNMLSRMSELAEQAANGTLGFAQRKRLDAEYQQLSLEVRRIANTTTFNGRELMSGQRLDRAASQIGADGVNLAIAGISGDGSKTYYSRTSTNALYVYDNTTGITRQIDSGGLLIAPPGTVTLAGDVYYVKNGELKRYRAETQTVESVGVSFAGIAIQDMEVSGDGRRLVYQDSSVGYSLHAVDLETRAQRTLFVGSVVGAYQMKLSADGTKLGFVSTGNFTGQNATARNQYFTVDLDSSSPIFTQLTRATNDDFSLDGVVANDGTAYVTGNLTLGGTVSVTQTFIHKYGPRGQSVETLRSIDQATGTPAGLLLGADDKTLSFVASAQWAGESTNGYPQVFRYDLEGGQIRQLTNDTVDTFSDSTTLLFSADGNYVVREDSGSVNLFFHDVSLGAESVSMEVGQGNRGGIAVSLGAINGTLKGLGGASLTSASAARAALVRTRDNIQSLAQLRGVYGAAGSRLDVAHSVLSGQVIQAEAARSQITDADVAQEAATLVRTQILQQAAASLLAQANQQPALSLQLLARS